METQTQQTINTRELLHNLLTHFGPEEHSQLTTLVQSLIRSKHYPIKIRAITYMKAIDLALTDPENFPRIYSQILERFIQEYLSLNECNILMQCPIPAYTATKWLHTYSEIIELPIRTKTIQNDLTIASIPSKDETIEFATLYRGCTIQEAPLEVFSTETSHYSIA